LSRYALPVSNEDGRRHYRRFYSANRARSAETLVAGQERLVVCRSAHARKEWKRGR